MRHILLLSIRSKVLLLTRTLLLQTLRELFRSLQKSCSDRRQKPNSVRIISRSQSQALRLMFPASNVEEKAAVSAKAPAGLKSLAVVWFIRMFSVCAESIRMNIQDLLLVWVWSVSRFWNMRLMICAFSMRMTADSWNSSKIAEDPYSKYRKKKGQPKWILHYLGLKHMCRIWM